MLVLIPPSVAVPLFVAGVEAGAGHALAESVFVQEILLRPADLRVGKPVALVRRT
jgi:hypothetical protein